MVEHLIELKKIIHDSSIALKDFSYRETAILKKKKRILNIPNQDLKAFQSRINSCLQNLYSPIRPVSAYGYMRANAEQRFTHMDAAASLIHSKYIFKFDVKDFFNSVRTSSLNELFQKDLFGLNAQEVEELLKIVTYKNRLPFGAPSSPSIINFLFLEVDNYLEKALTEIHPDAIYCRYCDDIMVGVNVNSKDLYKEIKRAIQNELIKYNLHLNSKKSTVLTHSKAMYVLGLKINEKINLDRKYIRNLRAIMNNLSNDMRSAMARYKSHTKSVDIALSLRSKIEYVGFIRGKNDEIYKKLLNQFHLVNQKIANYQAFIFKTTQFNNQIYEERRLDKSGIFEQFLSKFDNQQAIETFLNENNLASVLIQVPKDQNLQDGYYFSKEDEVKDSDLVAAIVYKDKKGNPTNKIAFLKVKEAQVDTDDYRVSYEVIPFDEAFSEGESTSILQRGQTSQEGIYEVRTVSILQSVPFKQDQDRINKMANSRVQLKKSETHEEAIKFLQEEFKEQDKLRKRASKGEVIPITIIDVTPGANKVFSLVAVNGMNISEFEDERFAEVLIYRQEDTKSGRLFKGLPYLVLKNSSQQAEFVYPLRVPKFSSDTVQVGGKSVIENLSDILFLLQEDFEDNYTKIDSALAESSEDTTLQSFIGDLIYKPKQEDKKRTIVIYKEKKKDASGKEIEEIKEWIEIAYSISPNKENPFFVAKRFVNGKSTPEAVVNIKLKKDKNPDKLSLDELRNSMKSVFKDMRPNVKMAYLRTDEKKKKFGYVNVDVKVDPKDPKTVLSFEAKPVKVESYLKFLGQLGVTAPIVPYEGTKEYPAIPRKKNEPYQRIGKGIIFEEANKPENELEKLVKQQEKPTVQLSHIHTQPVVSPTEESEDSVIDISFFNITKDEQNETEEMYFDSEADEIKYRPRSTALKKIQVEYTKDNSSEIYYVEGEVIRNYWGLKVLTVPSEDRTAIIALAKEKLEAKLKDIEVEQSKEAKKEPFVRKPRLAESPQRKPPKLDLLESSKSSTRITTSSISKEDIAIIKSMFCNNVNVHNLFETDNSTAWATWTKSAITLYKGANRSDLFHEAWHNFSQLYLSVAEKKALYNEIKNKVSELKDATDLQVEEWTAREFSKFALADGKYSIFATDALKVCFERLMGGSKA